MRVEIKSVYENVDEAWLEWWLKRLEHNEVMHGSRVIVQELKDCGDATFSSKDPTSPVVATTYYKIEKNE